MKTKITLAVVFCISTFWGCFAQASDAEAEILVNMLGLQKREVIKNLVSVTGNDSITFWKLYDEYDKIHKSTVKNRIQLYQDTAEAYKNMTPETADQLANRYFENRGDQEKLISKYYKKIKSATNPVVAFQFYQAEIYLVTQIRAQIMQQIPTYGELVSHMKNSKNGKSNPSPQTIPVGKF